MQFVRPQRPRHQREARLLHPKCVRGFVTLRITHQKTFDSALPGPQGQGDLSDFDRYARKARADSFDRGFYESIQEQCQSQPHNKQQDRYRDGCDP